MATPTTLNRGAQLLREARGELTQTKAAAELDTDVAGYWKIETGRFKPGRAMHIRMAAWAEKRGVSISVEDWDAPEAGAVVPASPEPVKRARKRRAA